MCESFDLLVFACFWNSIVMSCVLQCFVGEAIGCGSNNIWGVDEYTQWWMQKVSYLSCLSPRWFHLLDVSLHYTTTVLNYVVSYLNVLWFECIFFRSIIGFLGACKRSVALLWIVSFTYNLLFAVSSAFESFLDMMFLLWSILLCSWSSW